MWCPVSTLSNRWQLPRSDPSTRLHEAWNRRLRGRPSALYCRRMDWSQIRQRIAQGEGAHTEFKRALELRLVGRSICAFGNTGGGVLILGVDDAGQVVGVRGDATSARERLANFLQNGCNTPVRARCQHEDTAQGTVIWVEVPRQRGLEPLRYDGRVWVRRDRTTTEPSPMELQELFNAFGYVLMCSLHSIKF